MNVRRVRQGVTAAAVVMTAMVSSTASAQNRGRVFNPRPSPGNPDLVAYESLIDGRQELIIYRKSDGARTPVVRAEDAPRQGAISLPGLSGSTEFSSYSGDLDWRPLALDGRQWFAYVVSNAGTFQLRLNAVDPTGQIPARTSLAVPMRGGARNPAWSPDGKHLAFVSDSQVLHVVWNADRALRSLDSTALVPTRIGAAGSGVLHPAWAPRGLGIAYEASALGARRRSRIDAVNFDTVTMAVRGAPITLTEDLSVNAFRPTWSHDGRFVAFYMDRAGSANDQNAASIDIGMTAVQLQPTTGRILRGDVQVRLTSRFAEGVVQNETRGPSWTQLLLGANAVPAVVYAERDDAKGNPIYVQSVDAWLANRPREQARALLSPTLTTVNHREVSAVASNGFARYIYSSVTASGDAIDVFDDTGASWAKGPTPQPPVILAHGNGGRVGGRTTTGTRGGGGMFSGRRLVYSVATIGGAIWGGLGVPAQFSAADKGKKATSRQENLKYKPDFDAAIQQQRIGFGVAGLALLLNVLNPGGGGDASSLAVHVPSAESFGPNARPLAGLRMPIGRR